MTEMVDYIREFNSRIIKTKTCWLWNGSMNGQYGQFSFKGMSERAHIFSYYVNIGEIPDGLFVCHTCDNKRCVKPSHLFIGTYLENMQDRITKREKRGIPRSFPKHPVHDRKNSKLKSVRFPFHIKKWVDTRRGNKKFCTEVIEMLEIIYQQERRK